MADKERIFNVADIYVTCATIATAILLIFVYKEDDLRFLSIRPKKYREVKEADNHDHDTSSKKSE